MGEELPRSQGKLDEPRMDFTPAANTGDPLNQQAREVCLNDPAYPKASADPWAIHPDNDVVNVQCEAGVFARCFIVQQRRVIPVQMPRSEIDTPQEANSISL